MKYAFAGDRDIAVQVLQFLLAQGHRPAALILSEPGQASHAKELIGLVPGLSDEAIIAGKDVSTSRTVELLRRLELDFIFGIHFPHLISVDILRIPRHGFINLHPAFLPYNRGWHTPSWAILDRTPYGATLHVMSEILDAGDIIHQKLLPIRPEDTADTLYARVKALELEVFMEAWPLLSTGIHTRRVQQPGMGTSHRKKDLSNESIARILLEEPTTAGALIDRLRALTTSHLEEAAWFEKNGRRYRIQVSIRDDGVIP